MAATLNQSTIHDPAAENGIVQSPAIDLASIQSVLDSNSSSRIRLVALRAQTEPVPDTVFAQPIDDQELKDVAPVLKARRRRFTKRKIRIRHRTTLDTQPLENPSTTVQVEGTAGEIDHEAFGPNEALGSQETAPTSDVAVQTANVTPGQFLGLTVPPTGMARTRSTSAPGEMTQSSESIPTSASKEEYRRKIWEEKTRQAIERELEHIQCPCWPQCGCYLDGPRPPLDRAHTMPSRPRICISSVRDGPGNDEFYREIQELAQQARYRQAYRGSSDGTSQAGPSAHHSPSQAPTCDSLATTLICNPPSYGSTASTEGDSFLQLGITTNPRINTDLSAERLGDEDQAHTPTQAEMLMHVGGQHDDSNTADTDDAN